MQNENNVGRGHDPADAPTTIAHFPNALNSIFLQWIKRKIVQSLEHAPTGNLVGGVIEIMV